MFHKSATRELTTSITVGQTDPSVGISRTDFGNANSSEATTKFPISVECKSGAAIRPAPLVGLTSDAAPHAVSETSDQRQPLRRFDNRQSNDANQCNQDSDCRFAIKSRLVIVEGPRQADCNDRE